MSPGNLLNLGEPVLEIMFRAALVYLLVLIALRLSGKREIGQMNAFDLVLLLLLANAVQSSMVGADVSIVGGLVAGGTLVAMNVLVATLRLRSPRLRRLLQGTPTVLVLHGELQPAALKREAIDEDTLHAALREHGFAEVSEVEMVVLEIDGSISVVPTSTHIKRIRHPHQTRSDS